MGTLTPFEQAVQNYRTYRAQLAGEGTVQLKDTRGYKQFLEIKQQEGRVTLRVVGLYEMAPAALPTELLADVALEELRTALRRAGLC